MSVRGSPVEHVTDGTTAWADDAGPLVRIRGQAGTLATTALLGGAPWWWPEKLGSVSISTARLISVSATAAGLTLAAALFYLRVRTIRSLQMKRELHMLAHFLRDANILIKTRDLNIDIYSLSTELCNRIREYVSILIHRKYAIGVAIRIAAPAASGTVFKTVGRAGLNQHRQEGTTDLPSNQGVARLLRSDKGRQGVLIYHDLQAAREAGAYEEQSNDRKYPDDIKTFIVAPINGWDGEKKAMIGLLYITSPSMGTFKRKHTDSIGFVADSIALLYSELAIGDRRTRMERQYDLFRN